MSLCCRMIYKGPMRWSLHCRSQQGKMKCSRSYKKLTGAPVSEHCHTPCSVPSSPRFMLIDLLSWMYAPQNRLMCEAWVTMVIYPGKKWATVHGPLKTRVKIWTRPLFCPVGSFSTSTWGNPLSTTLNKPTRSFNLKQCSAWLCLHQLYMQYATASDLGASNQCVLSLRPPRAGRWLQRMSPRCTTAITSQRHLQPKRLWSITPSMVSRETGKFLGPQLASSAPPRRWVTLCTA